MRAVPQNLREASYGLGARRVTTSLRVVVPGRDLGHRGRAHPGVQPGIGETMVVAVAAGAPQARCDDRPAGRRRHDDIRDAAPGHRHRPGDRQ